MQLWATGFNAWDQLNFQKDTEDSSSSPLDVYGFKPILADEYIDVLRMSISSILSKSSSAFD